MPRCDLLKCLHVGLEFFGTILWLGDGAETHERIEVLGCVLNVCSDQVGRKVGIFISFRLKRQVQGPELAIW